MTEGTNQTEVVVPTYALKFYEILRSKAEEETIDGEVYVVFRGGITKEYDNLKFSRAHYTRIVKTLEHIGALQVIQRGHSSQPSVIVLHGTPTIEALSEGYLLTRPSEQRRIIDRSLDARVDNLERRLGTNVNYIDALIDIEARLQALEREAGNSGTST